MLDAKAPADLPAIVWSPDTRKFLSRGAGAPYPVDRLAEDVLRGVARNLCLIILPARARMIARMNRFAPELLARESRRVLAETLRDRKSDTLPTAP
jgi:hypothetical protein